MTGPAAGAPLDLSPLARIVDAGDASAEACRQALAAGREAVHVAFEAGVPASALLAGRTAVVDLVLTRLWHAAGADLDGLALVAAGGYGRGELQPASDVDIAILLPDPAPGGDVSDGARDEAISAWIRTLWDLGLDVGHSVRTVAQSVAAAREDLTVVTNLMEARLVAGAAGPFEAVRAALDSPGLWPPDAFLAAKLAERAERHRRFGQNPYRLEPNVKESEGGLRDFQTIAWICQRRFGRACVGICGGAAELAPLVDHGVLEPRELERLTEGLELLWRIRYLLHRLAGREEDRLLFDYQKRIAHAFGHPEDAHGNSDVEALMQRFYRTLAGLQRLSEMCLQGLGTIIDGEPHAPAVPVDARFELRGGHLEAVHDDVFVHYPPAMLELFLAFGRTPEAVGIGAPTVRLIRKHLKLVNARFRTDPKVRATFLDIFRLPDRLVRTLRLMYRHGVLAAYVPAFDRIVGRMQYDLFHQYTVDEHTMLVIRNLRRFFVPRFADEFPHCSEVAAGVARPHVLYLTALFHDIAKGRGGDHSVLGAVDMREFATAHAMAPHDVELSSWLVLHHLDMSMTAQRRDIDDPDVQLEFARLVRLGRAARSPVPADRGRHPRHQPRALQLVPEAACCRRSTATPGCCSSAGSTTRRWSTRSSPRARRRRARCYDAPRPADGPALDALWDGLGEDWFRQHQAIGIARHSEALLAHAASGDAGPLVSLRHASSRGVTEILIQTVDDGALFALIATALESLGLDVHSAVVHTTADGRALDTFDVLEADGSIPGRPAPASPEGSARLPCSPPLAAPAGRDDARPAPHPATPEALPHPHPRRRRGARRRPGRAARGRPPTGPASCPRSGATCCAPASRCRARASRRSASASRTSSSSRPPTARRGTTRTRTRRCRPRCASASDDAGPATGLPDRRARARAGAPRFGHSRRRRLPGADRRAPGARRLPARVHARGAGRSPRRQPLGAARGDASPDVRVRGPHRRRADRRPRALVLAAVRRRARRRSRGRARRRRHEGRRRGDGDRRGALRRVGAPRARLDRVPADLRRGGTGDRRHRARDARPRRARRDDRLVRARRAEQRIAARRHDPGSAGAARSARA